MSGTLDPLGEPISSNQQAFDFSTGTRSNTEEVSGIEPSTTPTEPKPPEEQQGLPDPRAAALLKETTRVQIVEEFQKQACSNPNITAHWAVCERLAVWIYIQKQSTKKSELIGDLQSICQDLIFGKKVMKKFSQLINAEGWTEDQRKDLQNLYQLYKNIQKCGLTKVQIHELYPVEPNGEEDLLQIATALFYQFKWALHKELEEVKQEAESINERFSNDLAQSITNQGIGRSNHQELARQVAAQPYFKERKPIADKIIKLLHLAKNLEERIEIRINAIKNSAYAEFQTPQIEENIINYIQTVQDGLKEIVADTKPLKEYTEKQISIFHSIQCREAILQFKEQRKTCSAPKLMPSEVPADFMLQTLENCYNISRTTFQTLIEPYEELTFYATYSNKVLDCLNKLKDKPECVKESIQEFNAIILEHHNNRLSFEEEFERKDTLKKVQEDNLFVTDLAGKQVVDIKREYVTTLHQWKVLEENSRNSMDFSQCFLDNMRQPIVKHYDQISDDTEKVVDSDKDKSSSSADDDTSIAMPDNRNKKKKAKKEAKKEKVVLLEEAPPSVIDAVPIEAMGTSETSQVLETPDLISPGILSREALGMAHSIKTALQNKISQDKTNTPKKQKKDALDAIEEVENHIFSMAQDLELFSKAWQSGNADLMFATAWTYYINIHAALEQTLNCLYILEHHEVPTYACHDLMFLFSHLSKEQQDALNSDQLALLKSYNRSTVWARYLHASTVSETLIRRSGGKLPEAVQRLSELASGSADEGQLVELVTELFGTFKTCLSVLTTLSGDKEINADQFFDSLTQTQQVLISSPCENVDSSLDLPAFISEMESTLDTIIASSTLPMREESPLVSLMNAKLHLRLLKMAYTMEKSGSDPQYQFWRLFQCLHADRIFELIYKAYYMQHSKSQYMHSHHLADYHKALNTLHKVTKGKTIAAPKEAKEIEELNVDSAHIYLHIRENKHWSGICQRQMDRAKTAAVNTDGFSMVGKSGKTLASAEGFNPSRHLLSLQRLLPTLMPYIQSFK